MHYILEMDLDHAVMASFEEAKPGHDLKWFHGRRFDTDELPERLGIVLEDQFDEYEQDVPEPSSPDSYPDFFELMRVPIGSNRCRLALIAAGADNVEFYPAPIIERSGRCVEGYYAMNVLGRVDCIDRSSSILHTDDDQIVRIESLVLDETRAHDLKIFRLDGYLDILVVDHHVADALRPLSGVRITPAQGWSDEYRF